MPAPHACPADFCETSPKCVTTFLPRVGESLIDYVIFPHEDEIPMVTVSLDDEGLGAEAELVADIDCTLPTHMHAHINICRIQMRLRITYRKAGTNSCTFVMSLMLITC